MKAYKLHCLNEDGQIEENGIYSKEKAEAVKEEMDKWPMNTRWGILQDIVEIDISE